MNLKFRVTGDDLVQEHREIAKRYESDLASIEARADSRRAVIAVRLAELESEEATLAELLCRIA